MSDKPEQFGHAETTKAVALVEVRAAIVREIGMRRKVYPAWCDKGRLTRADAVHQIAAMESALKLFDATVAIATAAQGLRDGVILSGVTVGHVPDVGIQERLIRRTELLDAALAQFDRYKVEPPADQQQGDEHVETFR